ncbi:MAG TPA: helix-turn-helix domain-containing protein [Acidimicrobiales bacterium]|nr:helix-turn-helix domain-containing protein [Acidimicrobiales bacterium]
MATDSAEKKLRAALDRLVAGTAVRTDGRLTVTGLAREADVSRATAHRYAAVLSDLAAAAQRPVRAAGTPDSGVGLAERNTRLAAENTLLRAEKEAMANALYVLTDLDAAVRSEGRG